MNHEESVCCILVASFLAPLAGNVYAQSSEEMEDLINQECIESGYMPNAGWMTTTDILNDAEVVLGYCEAVIQGQLIESIEAHGSLLLEIWLWVHFPIHMVIYYAHVNYGETVSFILTNTEDVPYVRWGVT